MNQDFTVQKKAIFDRKKNSCRGVHQKKKIPAHAVSEKKKFVQAENSPPPPLPPHHFSNGPSLNRTKECLYQEKLLKFRIEQGNTTIILSFRAKGIKYFGPLKTK